MTKLKRITTILLATIFTISLQAQQVKPEVNITPHTQFILDNKLDKNENKQFDTQIIASTIDADMDAWHKMPKDAIPQLTSVTKYVLVKSFRSFH